MTTKHLWPYGVLNADDSNAGEVGNDGHLIIPVRLLASRHLHIIRLLLLCYIQSPPYTTLMKGKGKRVKVLYSR